MRYAPTGCAHDRAQWRHHPPAPPHPHRSPRARTNDMPPQRRPKQHQKRVHHLLTDVVVSGVDVAIADRRDCHHLCGKKRGGGGNHHRLVEIAFGRARMRGNAKRDAYTRAPCNRATHKHRAHAPPSRQTRSRAPTAKSRMRRRLLWMHSLGKWPPTPPQRRWRRPERCLLCSSRRNRPTYLRASRRALLAVPRCMQTNVRARLRT